MDNLLLPKRLDYGIEELKAVFPVRPQTILSVLFVSPT